VFKRDRTSGTGAKHMGKPPEQEATMKKRILTWLADRGPAMVVELSSGLDEHPITVNRFCFELERDGLIEFITRDTYRVSDRGRATIDPNRSRSDQETE
jgi:Mn-dependent DtxR family transcriptional regulator